MVKIALDAMGGDNALSKEQYRLLLLIRTALYIL